VNELKIDRNIARWASLIAGFVGVLIMGVAVILAGFKFEGEWGYIGLGIAVAGAAGFILLDPQSLVKTATGRSGQYALTSVLVSVLFIIFAGSMYWIVKQINPPSANLRESSKYEISAKTVDLLKGMQEEVHAIGYFKASQEEQKNQADLWLRQYKQLSGGKISYEFIDPDRNPLAAQNARSGTIVFAKGDQKAEASVVDEQNLTNALVRVLTGKARKAYLLTGHGELTAEGFGSDGLSELSKTMGNANVTLETLNLLETPAVPDDADLIIIARPTSQFGPAEVDAIKAYLDKGKAAMFMFDPGAGGSSLSFGVLSADINADGSRIVTGGSDGTARLWDNTGKEVAALRGHTAVVNEVAFSPDGKRVATASFDNTVRVWDVATGKQVAQLEGTISGIQRMAYSPDGKVLASVGTDQNLNVWDASSNQPMSYSPIKLAVPLLSLAFSPDSATLAVSGGGTASGAQGAETTVFLRETATGAEVFTKTLPTNSIVAMAFSADGATLYNATFDGTLGAMDVATGESQSQALYSADKAVSGFALLGDGSFVFALGDGTLHIHPADATSADTDTVLSEHTGRVWVVRVSPDGQSFVSASQDGSARVWKVGQAVSSLQLAGHASSDKLLDYLTTDWGVTLNDDVVIDLRAADVLGSPVTLETFVQSQYDSFSPITRSLVEPLKAVNFQIARSVATADSPPDGVSLTRLITTTEGDGNSWGETDPPADGAISRGNYDPAADVPGPVAVAVSGENATTGARVVVFGDSDFVTDVALQNTTTGNADLAINSVNWLSSKEDLIDLPTTNVGVRTISQPLQEAEALLMVIVSCACLPLLFVVIGGVVWFTRRQRR